MATVVGQASAAATSVAIPAHAVGDLIIVAARGTAAPTVPAAGGTVPAWATLQSAAANSVGLTVVAFVATATNHTTGAFTSATHICVLVLRPASLKKLQTAAARSSVGNGNNTQTIIYPALVLIRTDGTSTGVRIGTRGTADSEVGTNIPAGWTNQSIQPAGASALMAVHTRLALVANPTADSIATTGTNAAYRAVTVEVEEVALGSTVTFDATITRAAAVAVASTVIPPPVTFAAVITTNQPYAGAYDCGEFTCGVGSPVAVDLQIVSIDLLDGLVAGQAQVEASLSRTRDSIAQVTGLGAVTAQQALTREMAALVSGAGAVTAQQARTRELAAAVIGSGVVAADTQVGHTIDLGVTVAGAASVSPALGRSYALASTVAGVSAITAQTVEQREVAASVTGVGVVAPSLTVTNASFINLDVAVTGQAAVAAQVARTLTLAVLVARAAAVSVQTVPLVGLAVALARQAAVTAQLTTSTPLAVNVARAAAVTPDLTVTAPVGGPVFFGITIARSATVVAETSRVGAVIDFVCSIKQVLCGEKLAGTFLCGSGPGATVEAQMGPVVVSLSTNVVGKATVLGSERGQRDLAATISRTSTVAAQLLVTRGLAADIARQANVAIDGRVIRLVQLECEIKVIPHLCGQYLSGQQVVGGTGPRANIAVSMTGRVIMDVPITGSATVSGLLRPSTPLAAAVSGQAFVEPAVNIAPRFSVMIGGQAEVFGLLGLKLALASQIVGQAVVTAKLILVWMRPVDCTDEDLSPDPETDYDLPLDEEAALVLSPAPEYEFVLAGAVDSDLTLDESECR